MQRIFEGEELLPYENKSLDSYKYDAIIELKESHYLRSMIIEYFKEDFSTFQYPTSFRESISSRVISKE